MTDKSMVISNSCVNFRLKKFDQGSGKIKKLLSTFFKYRGSPLGDKLTHIKVTQFWWSTQNVGQLMT